MANGLRSKGVNVAVWVLLALLIVGLAGFGTANFGGSIRSIGSVGDKEIDVNTYSRELQQDLRAFEAQTGQTLPLEQAKAFGIDQAVLQRLVSRAALDNETTRLGLSVGDEQVRRQLLDIQAFQGLDGKFDRDAYSYAISQANMSESAFEDSIREDTARTIVQSAVVGGIAAPSTFTKTLLNYVGERRNFTWAVLTKDDLATPLDEPTEDALRSYYDAHPEAFTLPEIKRISYAWLVPDMIVDDVPVNDEELRKIYNERIAEFVTPERRLVERLVYGSDADAEAAKAKLDAGEADFEALVKARGLTLDDVDMGDVTIDDLGSTGADIFAMDAPGVVGPLATDLGPALFRMNAVLAAQETTFEDARDDLVDEYASGSARRLIADQVRAIDDLLAGGATLEELATETDMELGTIDWTPDASDDIAAYVDFQTAAAAVGKDDFPQIAELDDGGIFALRLDEIVPPTLQPFEDVQAQVIEGWEIQEIDAALTAQAEALVPAISNGIDMETLGLKPTVEQDLTRDAFLQDTPTTFMTDVFAMKKGAVRIITGANGVYLVRVTDILPPLDSDADVAQMKAAIEGQASQAIAQDVFDAFARSIQAQTPVKLNSAAINAVHAQFP